MLHHIPYPRHIHPLIFIPAEVFHCQTDFGSDAYAVQILNQICLNIFTQKVPVRCITVRAFTKWYLVSIGIQGFYFVALPFKSIELRNLKSILRKAFDLVKHNLTLLGTTLHNQTTILLINDTNFKHRHIIFIILQLF